MFTSTESYEELKFLNMAKKPRNHTHDVVWPGPNLTREREMTRNLSADLKLGLVHPSATRKEKTIENRLNWRTYPIVLAPFFVGKVCRLIRLRYHLLEYRLIFLRAKTHQLSFLFREARFLLKCSVKKHCYGVNRKLYDVGYRFVDETADYNLRF